jgi:hypothetical protein
MIHQREEKMVVSYGEIGLVRKNLATGGPEERSILVGTDSVLGPALPNLSALLMCVDTVKVLHG